MADGNSNNNTPNHVQAKEGTPPRQTRRENPDRLNGESSHNPGVETVSDTLDERIHTEAGYYRNFLDQLLNIVGNHDEETVARMITLIRSGASQEDIFAALSRSSEDNRRSERRGRRGGDTASRQG